MYLKTRSKKDGKREDLVAQFSGGGRGREAGIKGFQNTILHGLFIP